MEFEVRVWCPVGSMYAACGLGLAARQLSSFGRSSAPPFWAYLLFIRPLSSSSAPSTCGDHRISYANTLHQLSGSKLSGVSALGSAASLAQEHEARNPKRLNSKYQV